MQSSVRIKSYPNKIVLYLDPNVSFDVICSDITEKFKETAQFFGSAKMILTLTGRELTEEEESCIIQIITSHSSLNILYLDNPVAQQADIKIEEETKEPNPKTVTIFERIENVRFYKSSLSDGDVLEAPCDLVILGNVASGATVISKQSIFVYGGLYGEAYAGYDNDTEYVISAFDFFPTRITIGDLEYVPKKGSKWINKKQFHPQIAYVKNDKILTDQLTKDLLDTLI